MASTSNIFLHFYKLRKTPKIKYKHIGSTVILIIFDGIQVTDVKTNQNYFMTLKHKDIDNLDLKLVLHISYIPRIYV